MKKIVWFFLNIYLVYSYFHLWFHVTWHLPAIVNDVLFIIIIALVLFYAFINEAKVTVLTSAKGFYAILIVWFVYSLFSFGFSGLQVGILGLRDYFQYPVLAVCFLVLKPSTHDLNNSLRVLILVSIVVAVLAIIGVFFPQTGFAKIEELSDLGIGYFRVVGTFGTPNTLSMMMIMISIPIVGKLVVNPRWLNGYILIFLFFIANVISISRSGMVLFPTMMLFTYILFSWYNTKGFFRKMKKLALISVKFSISIGLLLSIAILVVSSQFSVEGLVLDRVLNLTESLNQEQIERARSDPWDPYLKPSSIQETFFGRGIGSESRKGGIGTMIVFDSAYLKIYIEQGIIGIFLVLLLWLSIMRKSLQLSRHYSTRVIGVCAFVITIFCMTTSIYATFFDIFPVNLIFWFGAGAVFSIGNPKST